MVKGIGHLLSQIDRTTRWIETKIHAYKIFQFLAKPNKLGNRKKKLRIDWNKQGQTALLTGHTSRAGKFACIISGFFRTSKFTNNILIYI